MPPPGVYAFEEIGEALEFMPLAARRLLDATGRKLSLDGWVALPLDVRRRLVEAGAGLAVDPRALDAVERGGAALARIAARPDPDAAQVPEPVARALGATRPLDAGAWSALRPLDRYALAKVAGKPDKAARAYDEILGATTGVVLTHLGRAGEAHMVDVGAKAETRRTAVASARVRTTREVVATVGAGGAAKGDVLAAARIAGILASKRTAELVPLCHPVRTTRAAIDFELDEPRAEVRVRATVEAVDRTGVEMEAMVAASVASLTIYDMIKSADRWASIDGVRLESKQGGKSGAVVRPAERS
jgi:cyclic pyranopterin phosphate synthase